jgi:PAS domain-containing protein
MRTGACVLREVDLATNLRALRALPVGVVVWQLRDAKDVRSLRFVAANPASERELGVSLRFALGRRIADCFPKLLDTPIPERCRQAILSGKPHTFGEFVYHDARVPEGVFWVDCFPLPDRCVGVALENITERKRETQAQSRALQLLHRVTLFLNDAPTVLDAARFCVDEICTQIGWPVGRFFLSDELSPSRFIANPVWHFSDAPRFKAFRMATELYERDLSNKLALEYRTIQGKNAGLTKSVGFSVVENDHLRGVLEFSSEGSESLDEHVFRAISNVGFQLGQVFARERLAREFALVQDLIHAHHAHHDAVAKTRVTVEGSLLTSAAAIGTQSRLCGSVVDSSKGVVEAAREVRQRLAELRRLIARPASSAPCAESQAR